MPSRSRGLASRRAVAARLVALAAIIAVIVLCASFAPVVLQRRTTQGLINLDRRGRALCFRRQFRRPVVRQCRVHGGGRLRLGAARP